MGEPGYTVRETLHQGAKSEVFRATRVNDGRSVILKVHRNRAPDRRHNAEICHEFALASRIASDGVVRALSVEEFESRTALVLEDFGGITLRQLLERRGPLAVEPFLGIATQLCETLGEIHQHGIIHKDIKPHNILINPDTGVVKITDFSIASTLTHETATLASPRELAGTLAYMAPEQTGRMNRGIDQRADLYSLGVTFYELLTGQRPFPQRDPLELVHAHIALEPPQLHEAEPSVPRALSAIVAKLMAKDAEKRYQSAHGIRADLEECLRRLRERGAIEDNFMPGRNDLAGAFRIPQKVYGREEELDVLMAAFEHASRGAAELLLVSGYSGIGKTSLVHEIHKSVIRTRGYFTSGKFDQLNRRIPYAAIVHALRELLRQILTEPVAELEGWKKRIQGAVEPNGQLLVDLIPELQMVIGPQPPVQEMGPAESQNRFYLVLQSFIRAVATREHPQVIFLDDLQWADQASLKLLHLLLTDPESSALLLIGAYRDNEVDAAHPLTLALNELRRTGTIINVITLKPLGLQHINQIIADTLSSDALSAKGLTELVAEKTHGNPFFMGQFLMALHQEGLIVFDTRSSSWRWDLQGIQGMTSTENVVAFMAGQIRRLAPRTQHILKLAACIGHQFDLKTLVTICERTPGEAAADLWEAMREGLLLPLDTEYRFLHAHDGRGAPNPAHDFNVSFRFLHDRVQQAAYLLIDDGRQQHVHLRIGRLMLEQTGHTPKDEELFEILHHMNFAAALLTDPGERIELAQWNLRAGKNAKASTANEAAANYFAAGMSLLPEERWEEQYDLTLSLYTELGECEYLNNHFDRAERLFDVVLSHARSTLEQAHIYDLRMILYATLGRFADAIRVGRAGLALFGILLPETAEELKAAVDVELADAGVNLAGRRIEELFDAPPLTDASQRAILKLLMNLAAPAYLIDPTGLYIFVVAKQVNISLKYGLSEMSDHAYMSYGYVMAGILGQYNEGYAFGKLALDLNDKLNNVNLACKLNFLFGVYLHFMKPLRAGLAYCERAYRVGLEMGDFVYLSFACHQTIVARFGQGEELMAIQAELDKFLTLMQRTKNAMVTAFLTVARQVLRCLQGCTRGRYTLSDDDFDEDGFVASVKGDDFAFIACFYFALKAQVLFLHGDYAGAFSATAAGEARAERSVGYYFTTELRFYACLATAALYQEKEQAEQRRYTVALTRHLAALKSWAESCPENYRHKQLLVEAELARISGRDLDAMDLYDRAIESAMDNNFLQNQALANELCAKFHLSKNRKKIARAYLIDAYHGYAQWGATAKAASLPEQYPGLIEQRRQPGGGATLEDLAASTFTASALQSASISPGSKPSTGSSSSGSGSRGIDLMSVLKASHAFASEMELDRLLGRVMHIVAENAGAERGVLLLEQGGRLLVMAEHSVRSGTSLCADPLEQSDAAAAAIAHLAHRTSAPLVLQDAGRLGAFTSDPYVVRRRPRSVLCTPILHQGKSLGVLYLENNLTAGAFTSDRLEVLRLLSTEIAISIENARLYAGLKEQSRAYRRFVPHEMLALLGKESIVDVSLGDYVQRDMAVLFSDIRSFTTISESMSPRETFEFVNAYLEVMGPLIREHRGYIDKYIGDAIMALFPEHAGDALAAAIAMQQKLRDLNADREAAGRPPIGIRIGIHTGSLILGTVGERERMEGTVISDAVNLSARLEGLCGRFGVGIIASEQTLAGLDGRGDIPHRFLGSVKVKGKAQSVGVFEIFGADPPDLIARKLATKCDFEEGVHCLTQGDATGAIVHFRAIMKSLPEDLATRYLVRQAAEALQRGVDGPD